MMEKGVSKHWTQEQEELWVSRLRSCRTFAERHLTMTIRDLLKYDGRTKQGKSAIAQGRLRLATATDVELEEIARLEAGRHSERLGEIPGLYRASLVAEKLGLLKNTRAKVRREGVKRSELICP